MCVLKGGWILSCLHVEIHVQVQAEFMLLQFLRCRCIFCSTDILDVPVQNTIKIALGKRPKETREQYMPSGVCADKENNFHVSKLGQAGSFHNSHCRKSKLLLRNKSGEYFALGCFKFCIKNIPEDI